MPAETIEIRLIPLAQIPWEECFSFQARDQMSEEHIRALTTLVRESDEERQQTRLPLRNDLFPPLTVFTRGGLSDLYYLADGFHRYEALERAQRDAWLCEVHVVEDPLYAAKAFSLKANTTHGLRRDSATCRRVFTKARVLWPKIAIYGEDGIEGRTGLSRGWLHDHLKRLRAEGTPDEHHVSYVVKNPRKSARTQRVDAKTNPKTAPSQAKMDDLNREAEREDTHRPKMTDRLGRTVPRQLEESCNIRDAMAFVRDLGMFISRVDELAGKPGWQYLDVAAVGRALKNQQSAIKAAAYYTECPRCKGGEECQFCKGAGFITSPQYGRLSDQEKASLGGAKGHRQGSTKEEAK